MIPNVSILSGNRIRPKLFIIAAVVVSFTTLLSFWAYGHDIITTNLTYTRDISRIMARRCLACHNTNSAIPLTRYDEVRPWAVDIKQQVLSRAMPPWGAVKGFGDLRPDNALSQEEIMIICAWVIGGAPQGDKTLAPKSAAPLPEFPTPRTVDAETIETRAHLEKAMTVLGIRPIASAASARITAHLPDGRIQPLIWLYQFDAKSKRVFLFREPLALPSGTEVESSEPLRFALEEQSTETSQAR